MQRRAERVPSATNEFMENHGTVLRHTGRSDEADHWKRVRGEEHKNLCDNRGKTLRGLAFGLGSELFKAQNQV